MEQQEAQQVLNIRIGNVRGQVDLTKYLKEMEESNEQTDENYKESDLNNKESSSNKKSVQETAPQPLQCAHCEQPATYISLHNPYSQYHIHNPMMFPVSPQCNLCDLPATFLRIYEPNRFHTTNVHHVNQADDPLS